MTQAELEREVAAKVGESVSTIRKRGFSLFTPLKVFDPDDATQAEPQIIDWDEVESRRYAKAA